MKVSQAGTAKKQWTAPKLRRLGAGDAEGASVRPYTDSYSGS
jgi:hypothetical protein